MKIPALYHLYRAPQFDLSWVDQLMRQQYSYNLPTEIQTHRRTDIEFQKARYGISDFCVVNKEVVHWPTYVQVNWNHLPVVSEVINLIECYSDHGYDGHVDMQMIGWMFVPANDFKAKLDKYVNGDDTFEFLDFISARQVKSAGT